MLQKSNTIISDLVAKKTAEIERKKKIAVETDDMIKVYEKQKAAKGVFITKISHENSEAQEKLAVSLADKIRAKTGAVLKEAKEHYESDECSALRGKAGHAEELAQSYADHFERYEDKIKELASTIEHYQEAKERRTQLEGVVKGASGETENWKSMAATQKKKHAELSKKYGHTHKDLKVASAWKDELAKVLAETERKALENEKFKIHAQTTVDAARKLLFYICFYSVCLPYFIVMHWHSRRSRRRPFSFVSPSLSPTLSFY